MRMYIPESELNNADNIQRITDILEKVPETDLMCMDGVGMTLDDAVQAIRELGEIKLRICFVAVVLVPDMVAFATHLPPCHRTLWDSMGGKLLNFLKKVQF